MLGTAHEVHERPQEDAPLGHASSVGHDAEISMRHSNVGHDGHHGSCGGGGGGNSDHHAHMVDDFRRRFWVSLLLSFPIFVLAPMIQEWLGLRDLLAFRGDSYLQFALSTVVFFYGGKPFLTGLWQEVNTRRPGMMTLIALAITVAYAYSSAVTFGVDGSVFFWELASLIDIMLLGHWIEMRSVMGASKALEKLVELLPSDAHLVQDDGSTSDVLVSELTVQDRVLVKPGEKFPTDGLVVDGRTTVDLSMLTGESAPVEKGQGDEIIGGAVNGEAAVVVQVSRTGEATYLSQVIDLVRKAQESRSKTQDLANRAAVWLTGIALGAGALTLAAWLVAGHPFDYALERMVTVMVITCPHALGLAIPLVVSVSTSLAAGNGLLIRDRTAFERARDLDAIIFDKTGTLTEGRFGVTDTVAFGGFDTDEVLRLAASLESQSEHPIGRGIVNEAMRLGVNFPVPSQFRTIPGKGAEAVVDSHTVKVVSPGYLREQLIKMDHERTNTLAEEGKTVVYVLVDDQLIGAIALADIIRSESRAALDELRGLGVRVMMLTGDAQPVAQWVARELALDDYFAEVLPHEKAAKVKEVAHRGFTVGMVGDGINDAPALAQADVGIAIGAGADVAVESADIVLVRSDPRDVVNVLTLARTTYRKMVQNLWWATGYNVAAIPLAAGVLAWAGWVLSPAVGAVLMSVSTVVVAINARLLRMSSHTRLDQV